MDSNAAISSLGLIVLLGVIGIPLYILAFTTILEKPREGRIRWIFFGTAVTLLAAAIALTAIGGAILRLIIPQ